MEICCVWWTTKEEALADAAPYVLRPVRLAARRLLGEHVEKLLGGRCNATQSFHEHQPRYGFLDPLRVVVLRPRPLPACILLDPSVSIRMVFDPSLSSRVVERPVHLTATLLAPHDRRQRLIQRVSKPVEVANRRHIATLFPRASPRRRRLDERVPALDLVIHVPERKNFLLRP